MGTHSFGRLLAVFLLAGAAGFGAIAAEDDARPAARLTLAQVKELAFKETGEGSVLSRYEIFVWDDEWVDNEYFHELTILNQGAHYTLRIFDSENSAVPAVRLTLPQAREIVFKETDGGTVGRYERRLSNNKWFHHFTVFSQGARHTLQIDDAAGAIISYAMMPADPPPVTGTDPVTTTVVSLPAVATTTATATNYATSANPPPVTGTDLVTTTVVSLPAVATTTATATNYATPTNPPWTSATTITSSAVEDRPRLFWLTAFDLAAEKVPGGRLVDYDLERKRGVWIHEMEIFADNKLHKIEVMDQDGTVAVYAVRQNDDLIREIHRAGLPRLPAEQALGSAFEAVPALVSLVKAALAAADAKDATMMRRDGLVVTSYELDLEHGAWVHEFEIRFGDARWEVEVNDADGSVRRAHPSGSRR